MELLDIIRAADSFLSVAVLVWIVHLGFQDRAATMAEYNERIDNVINYQQMINNRLMTTIEELCKRRDCAGD